MNVIHWLIFGTILFVPIIIAAFSSVFVFRRNRRGRRTPLTGNLLRGPGESLRTEIERKHAMVTGLQDGTFDMSITRGSLRCNI